MNTAVRPQDDLYEYANGTWLKKVPIPPDRSSYGVDALMTERSLLQQRDLIEGTQISKDAEKRKLSDLYSSYMNEARVERLGLRPMHSELQLISNLNGTSDVGPLMAHLDRIGIASPIATFIRRTPSAPRNMRSGSPKAAWDCPTAIPIWAMRRGRSNFELSTANTSRKCCIFLAPPAREMRPTKSSRSRPQSPRSSGHLSRTAIRKKPIIHRRRSNSRSWRQRSTGTAASPRPESPTPCRR